MNRNRHLAGFRDSRLGSCFVLGWLLATVPTQALDLKHAQVEVLHNGLTLAVLEEKTFPVVSVQMLYRVGARNEEVGRTGLAHFLEHMAFRATEEFPDTEVVSAIYAVGGEWHGYTWTDQTTYFETVPREHLELVLRIEAERMGRLLIPPQEVAAERGAVLSELHGYQNDPGTVLLDAAVATSFLQHPYRNNTIGWESDVESLQHRDVVDFYRRHYRPSNAVLAVVGDVRLAEVRELVERHFGALGNGEPTPPPRTVEPDQAGERRVQILGLGGSRLFVIAYRAPSVRNPDWPAFLVLQEVLGGGEGVNFLQNDWGVGVRPGSRLAGIVEDLTTWYPPSFDDYLFVLSGTPAAGQSAEDVETLIERRLETLRSTPVGPDELAAAQAGVVRHLIFDLETTEDAAHQLASYLGYQALTQLSGLPAAIDRVTAKDIRRVANTYLQPRRRTIGWYQPDPSAPSSADTHRKPATQLATGNTLSMGETRVEVPQQASAAPVAEPSITRLKNGVPVIFQHVPLSPGAAYLQVLVPSTAWVFAADASRERPVWGHTSVNWRFLSEELDVVVREARQALDTGEPWTRPAPETIEDPALRLEHAFEALLETDHVAASREPAAIALVGDLDQSESLEVLESVFSDLDRGERPAARPLKLSSREATVRLPVTKAQAQLGYVVPAPVPSSAESLVWRAILYVLTHGYEGRLGKEAISRRGLLYYIDSSYLSNGASAWITLGMGVDPGKLAELRQLLVETLQQLEKRPPTAKEVDEARQYLIGRRRSAAQSNAEISEALTTEWVEQGRLRTEAEFVQAVMAVRLEDVLSAIPEFVAGAIVVVENPE